MTLLVLLLGLEISPNSCLLREVPGPIVEVLWDMSMSKPDTVFRLPTRENLHYLMDIFRFVATAESPDIAPAQLSSDLTNVNSI